MQKRKIILFLFIFAPTSCSNDSVPSTIKAKVVTPIGGSYDYETVTIESLTNLESVEGKYVNLKGGGELDITKDIDEIVKSDDPQGIYKSRGKNFSLNYMIKDDVVIAKDFTSLAALTIYHNYEYVFKFWEENFNLTLDKFGKLTIYNNPKLTFSEGDFNVDIETKVNAAFLPGARDFWLFKQTPLALIPLKMNRGVLAHEFSHAIFDDIFTDRDLTVYETENEDNEYILSAINEGIADYYAFMVTGRSNDFALSLDFVDSTRTLPVSWTLSSLSKEVCQDSFYCEGSVIASALFEIANTLSSTYSQSSVAVGQAVYNALSSDAFKQLWSDNKNSGNFLYSHLLIEIKNNADPSDQSTYCEAFKKWFDKIDEKTYLEDNGC